jgi:GGDEF domain-containing protein
MADDYRAEKVLWRPGTTEFPTGHPSSRHHANQAYRAAAPAPEAPTEEDAASILGFGVGTLPADVLQIILKLLAEAGRWKAEANAADRHRHHLEYLADSYPGLPCLNTHAFLRDLDGFAQSATQSATQSANGIEPGGEIGAHLGMVLLVHVSGIDQAVARHGLDAGDHLAHRIFESISARTPDGDLLACLGFGAYAVAVPGIDADTAQRRLDELLTGLAALAPDWRGEAVPVSATGAIAPIVQGQSAALILHIADESRLGTEDLSGVSV